MKQNDLPLGWTEDLIQEVIRHYETQTEDEAVAEDEASLHSSSTISIEVPTELVPVVRDLIARFQNSPAQRQPGSPKRRVVTARN